MTAIPKSCLLMAATICALASVAAALGAVASAEAAQGSDRLAGTWRLNVAQSKYEGTLFFDRQ